MDTAYQSYKILSQIGKSPFGDEGNSVVEGEETDGAITKLKFGIVGILAIAAIGSGIASMVLTSSAIVDVACLCLFAVAPIAVIQKFKLNKLPTLRSQHNELRTEVNKFAAQNERLKGSIANLDLECSELEGLSAEYKILVKERGDQVDRLIAIVKENGKIQAKIIKSLQTQIMQQAMDTILKCDTDEDFSISQKEIPQFKLRMSRIPGVEFDEANFDRLFKEKKGDLHLGEIMVLFRNLTNDIPEDENVFHLKPNALLQRQ